MSGGLATDKGAVPGDIGRPPGQGPPGRLWRWARRAFLANLVAQIGIVVTGGMVRVTGSGLGCPTWPQCVPGSFTPVPHQAQGYHKYVEFGNRTLTSVVSLTAVAVLVVAVFLVRAGLARRGALPMAVLPVVLVAAQAVLGGVTVLTGLSPATVAAHFLVSMVLVAASTWLLLALTPAGRTTVPVRREVRLLVAAVAAVAGAVLVLGTVVTGSGPHSGDAVTPARFGFDPGAVAWLHADAVWLFVGLVVALLVAARLTDAGVLLNRRLRWLLAVTLVQGVIGYVQYATGLPILAVVLHMLGACLLVVVVTTVVAALARPVRGPTLSPDSSTAGPAGSAARR